MNKEIFGNNIETNCEYCDNFNKSNNEFRCDKKKEIKKGKCRKFEYNPTLRIPKSKAKMMKFKKEDFEI